MSSSSWGTIQCLRRLWKCKKAQRYQTCIEWDKNQSSSVRAKLLHKNMVFRKAASKRNEWNRCKNELSSVVLILDISKIGIRQNYEDKDYKETGQTCKKYIEKAKLCYTDTNSFIIHVKSEHVYADLQEMLRKEPIHQTIKLIHH